MAMLVVGLTGGVGMGKSTVAQSLAARGIDVVDTDVIAREVVLPGSDGVLEVERAFGGSVVGPNGALDRKALAREVFGDPERRKLLESILHPRIRARWKRAVEGLRAEGKTRAVIVIPLLFETGAQQEMSRTVCVACSEGVQMTRLSARGWTDQEARQRIAAQWPASRKMELADQVIWNEASVEVCEMQSARVFE